MNDELDLDIVKDGIDYFMDFRIEEMKLMTNTTFNILLNTLSI